MMDNMDNENINNKKLTSSQLRKIKKPLIEKRRRERINESLSQLKSLILEALNKDESQYNKMEKADILELTVKHLKNLHKQPSMLASSQVSVNQPIIQPVQIHSPKDNTIDEYKAGFIHCASEVQRYIQSANVIKSDIKNHITNHLNSHVQDMPSSTSNNNNNGSSGIHENSATQPIGPTYVQILPKDGSSITGSGECLTSQVIQGIPCVQSIPVLNGQTIFLASAIPTNMGTQQLQPMLQLTQPVPQQIIANANLNQQLPSPSFTSDSSKQETISPCNDNFNNVSPHHDRINENSNVIYQQQQRLNNTSSEHYNMNSIQRNKRNSNCNLNVQTGSTSSSKSHGLMTSNASMLSTNTYEDRMMKPLSCLNDKNLNTFNINHIHQPTSNKVEYKTLQSRQIHKSMSDNMSFKSNFVYNQLPKPQCLDRMWRPW